MNAILLTRRSAFQIFCANALWKDGYISAVIVEDGSSVARGSGIIWTLGVLWRNARLFLDIISKNPLATVDYIKLYLYRDKYLGGHSTHNKRLLVGGYSEFAKGLPVINVEDVNSSKVSDEIRAMKPDVVFVFGTRLIKSEVFANQSALFVNMHWGWSPDYRAEGIVSALGVEGPSALGVTVHMLSERTDGGDILHQVRPTIDNEDNFYSIGLKLTLIGIDLFKRVLDEFQHKGSLSGLPQNLSHGRVYSSRYMKANPGLYHEAWKNLKSS